MDGRQPGLGLAQCPRAQQAAAGLAADLAAAGECDPMSSCERESILRDLTPPYALHEPEQLCSPIVFSSPHSGRVYPQAFLAASRLSPASLRKSEDCFIEELFEGVVALGSPLIAARFPRAYLDVNREPYELDPALFEGVLPDFANTRSLRVVGGLGTIARVVADSEEIYRRPLSVEAAFERIERLYRPYHAQLRRLLDTARRRFGMAILIDCHSMPSTSSGDQGARPHFVVGDRFGASCTADLTRFIREKITDLGYEVVLNRPYAGGFITEHYGEPRTGIHAVQIEINRALYMNETKLEPSGNFWRLRRDLERLAGALMAAFPAAAVMRTAAE